MWRVFSTQSHYHEHHHVLPSHNELKPSDTGIPNKSSLPEVISVRYFVTKIRKSLIHGGTNLCVGRWPPPLLDDSPQKLWFSSINYKTALLFGYVVIITIRQPLWCEECSVFATHCLDSWEEKMRHKNVSQWFAPGTRTRKWIPGRP